MEIKTLGLAKRLRILDAIRAAISLDMLRVLPVYIEVQEMEEEEAKDFFQKSVANISYADLVPLLSQEASRSNIVLDEAGGDVFVAQYLGPLLPQGTTQLPEGATIKFFRVRYFYPEGDRA